MINIRNAEITDAERLVEIYGYYVKNTAITFEYDIPSLTEFRQRMEQTMRMRGRLSAGPLTIGRAR